VLGLYGNPPKGLILHSAGPAEPGIWRVFDIWESKALFDRFFEQRLKPTLDRLGLNRPPARQEFFPIHNAFAPQPAILTTLTNVAVAGARR